jgi:hypothetical protein
VVFAQEDMGVGERGDPANFVHGGIIGAVPVALAMRFRKRGITC